MALMMVSRRFDASSIGASRNVASATVATDRVLSSQPNLLPLQLVTFQHALQLLSMFNRNQISTSHTLMFASFHFRLS